MNYSVVIPGLAIYLVTMMVFLCNGPADRRVAAPPQQMYFKHPWNERIGAAMMGLLLLGGAVSGATVMAANAPWFVWCYFVPCCLALAALFFYIAGPKDVRIDLNTRTCDGTKGWTLRPRRTSCALLETSHIRVFPTGSASHVVLWIGGIKDPMFALGSAAKMSQAMAYAEEIAVPLQLPVRRMTLQEMRNTARNDSSRSYH